MTLNILVTGAGGFIGSHLIRQLYEQGHFVRAVDIKWPFYREIGRCSEKYTLDLRDYRNCELVVEDMDYVFHLAADMGGIGYITSVGADIIFNNTQMTLNLLKASIQSNVTRFFYSSSACVYPLYRQTTENVTGLKESDAFPADPDTYYGWEKLYGEKACAAFSEDYGLSVRIARYHNVYGPYGTFRGGREKAPAALCRKVAAATNPGEITIWGDGKQTRSFLYIQDCVEATIKLMESNYDEPLNIGSDQLISIDELADLIIKISGKKITKKYDVTKPQGVRGRNADITLAKKILGWKPKVSLEEGLRKTYFWVESQLLHHKKIVR